MGRVLSGIQPTGDIAGHTREDVSIGEHDLSGAQRWFDNSIVSVTKVGGMQNRKLFRRQGASGFPGLDERLEQWRRIPFCDDDFLTYTFQPSL